MKTKEVIEPIEESTALAVQKQEESATLAIPDGLPKYDTALKLATAFAGIEMQVSNQASINNNFSIVDDLSHQAAISHIKTTASLTSKLEERKLKVSLPYRDVTGKINDYAKKLYTGLVDSRKLLSDKITDYENLSKKQKEEEANQLIKQAQKDAELLAEKQKDTIKNLRTLSKSMLDYIDKINEATLISELKEISTTLPPKDVIPEELQPFDTIHEIYLKVNSDCRLIGSLKYKALKAGEQAKTKEQISAYNKALEDLQNAIDTMKNNLSEYLDETEVEIEQEGMKNISETHTIAAIGADQLTSSVSTATKSYTVSDIKVIDKSLIPLDWLMIDESAVKAYVKQNKILKTTIVHGVEIVITSKVR